MSYEEDYLMQEVSKINKRLDALEAIVTYPKGRQVQGELVDGPEVLGEAVNADTGEVTPAGEPLPEIATTDEEGGEQSSAGTSSETSTEKQPTSSGTSKRSPRKPARTTERRSSKDQGESSTARSTGTSGPGTDD